MKKNKQVNVISRVLRDAAKNGKIIALTCRVEKTGRWSKANGVVKEVKVNVDGEPYVLVKDFTGQERQDGQKWRNIRLSSITSVRANGLRYK